MNLDCPELNPDGVQFVRTSFLADGFTAETFLITKDGVLLKDFLDDNHKFFASTDEPNVLYEQLPSVLGNARDINSYRAVKQSLGFDNQTVDLQEAKHHVKVSGRPEIKWNKWVFPKSIALDNDILNPDVGDNTLFANFTGYQTRAQCIVLNQETCEGLKLRQDPFRLRFFIAIAETADAVVRPATPKKGTYAQKVFAKAAASSSKKSKNAYGL